MLSGLQCWLLQTRIYIVLEKLVEVEYRSQTEHVLSRLDNLTGRNMLQ